MGKANVPYCSLDSVSIQAADWIIYSERLTEQGRQIWKETAEQRKHTVEEQPSVCLFSMAGMCVFPQDPVDTIESWNWETMLKSFQVTHTSLLEFLHMPVLITVLKGDPL